VDIEANEHLASKAAKNKALAGLSTRGALLTPKC